MIVSFTICLLKSRDPAQFVHCNCDQRPTEALKEALRKKREKVLLVVTYLLILNVPCISESCIEIKIKLKFYFRTSL